MLRRWMGAAAALALAIAAGASQAAEPVRIGFSIAQTGLFAAAVVVNHHNMIDFIQKPLFNDKCWLMGIHHDQ